MFIVVFIYFFGEGYGEVIGRKRGEGKREMSRDMERERDCVGARENWTGLIIFRPDSFRLSQPGPLIHPSGVPRRYPASWPGSSSPPSPLSLPTLAFSPFTDATPLSLPLPPSLFFPLATYHPILYNPLTSDPRHHPNLSKKTVTLFPLLTLSSTSVLSAPARACPLSIP